MSMQVTHCWQPLASTAVKVKFMMSWAATGIGSHSPREAVVVFQSQH